MIEWYRLCLIIGFSNLDKLVGQLLPQGDHMTEATMLCMQIKENKATQMLQVASDDKMAKGCLLM